MADQLSKGNVRNPELDIGVGGFKLFLQFAQFVELALYGEVVDDFEGYLGPRVGQRETGYRGAQQDQSGEHWLFEDTGFHVHFFNQRLRNSCKRLRTSTRRTIRVAI